MAHDRGVGEQRGDPPLVESRDGGGCEVAKGGTEAVALAQNGEPGEAGLKSLEDELLEEPLIVDDGTAPFVVVIGPVERIAVRPRASSRGVCGRASRRR